MNDDSEIASPPKTNVRLPKDPVRNSKASPMKFGKNPEVDFRRVACGVLAIGFGLAAVGLGFLGLVSPNTASWALGTFGKVAFLFAFVWLAWPQIMWLSSLPGGGIAMVALAAGGMFFILRPRAMLYVVPVIAATMSLFIAIGFVQRYLLPPK